MTGFGWALVCRLLSTAVLLLSIEFINPPRQESESPDEKTDLPTARQIIENHIQATGGYEVLDSLSSVQIRYSATKSGEPFRYELFKEHGKYYTSSRYASGRVYERGINNGISWTCTNGEYRQLHGQELAGIVARHQDLSASTKWITTCKSIKLRGVESINDRKVFKLHFVHDDDREVDKYFDCQSGLLVRSASLETHGSSTHRVTRDYSEFKQFGDMLIPLTRTIHSKNRIYVYRVESYQVNEIIPKGTFDIPQTIDRGPINK